MINIELPKIEIINPKNIALYLKSNSDLFYKIDNNLEKIVNKNGNKKIKIESNQKSLFALSSFCLAKLYLNFIILKTISLHDIELIKDKNLYLKESSFGLDNRINNGSEPHFEKIHKQFLKLRGNYKLSTSLLEIKEEIYDTILFFKNNDLLKQRFFIYSTGFDNTYEPNFEEILETIGIYYSK